MLLPKRVKYRRVHRGRLTGKALRGNTVTYGDFGLQALDPALLARPEALISIGDHAFNDLMPISAIGGQTLWIDPYPGIHEPEYTWCVHTLAELAAFLDTIS